MKLYTYAAAPNHRRIEIYLKEKGLEPPFETVIIDLFKGEQQSPEYLAINPIGKIPSLVTDDGTIIPQSLNIVEYIEELYPEPPMIGATPEERGRVKAIERLIDGEIMGTMGIMAQNMMPLYADRFDQHPACVAYGRRRQELALELLDKIVGDNKFIAGDCPTIADATLFATYEFAFLVDAPLDPKFRNLTRWHKMFAERPSTEGLTLPGA